MPFPRIYRGPPLRIKSSKPQILNPTPRPRICRVSSFSLPFLPLCQAFHPPPSTLHPAPCTLHPAPCTLHPAPSTLHPPPCTDLIKALDGAFEVAMDLLRGVEHQRSRAQVHLPVWVVRAGGDDGELRPWHYIYVHSIESRLIMRVRYDSSSSGNPKFGAAALPSLGYFAM